MDDLIAELREHVAPSWEKEVEHTRAFLQLLCEEVENKHGIVAVVPPGEALTDNVEVSVQTKKEYIALSETWKQLHAQLSKFSKSFDKKVKGDLVDLAPPGEGGYDEAMLQALLQHFYREGNFAMGDALAAELQSMTEAQWKEPFEEMHHLVEALSQHDIGPAIAWIERASRATASKAGNGNGGSASSQVLLPTTAAALAFKLHSLTFIDMLKGGSWSQAIQYARAHLAPLASRFPHDVETLLGAMAFAQGAGGLGCSPYAPLLREELWAEAEETLVACYCACRGLARESALRLALNLGTMAWPKISRVLAIMKHRPGVEWDPAEELPVEIETGEQAKFHSVFVCPVLRQQSTEDNPPMMMPCGHVISREALQRLCKGNPNYRIKCPYCPAESTAGNATRLHF